MKKAILHIYKIKAKAISLSLLLCGTLSITNAQQVSYKVIYDDPLDVPNLFATVSPFFAEATDVGDFATIGFILQGNYNMGKRLAFEASFARAYLDINARGGMITGTQNALSKHNNIEAGGVFFFRDKIKKKKVKIVLHSTSKTSTYIMAPATVHAQIGLRGGLFYYNYALQTDATTDYFIGTNPNSGKKDTLTTFNYHGISTNMNVTGVYLGIVRRKTYDILIQTGGAQKSSSAIGEVYADLFIAPVVHYSDVLGYSLSSTPSKYIGWRVGYQLIQPKAWGFQGRVEVGQKPGWGVKSGLYLNASFGISIGKKLKSSIPKPLEEVPVSKEVPAK